jgi:hypothetical protein
MSAASILIIIVVKLVYSALEHARYVIHVDVFKTVALVGAKFILV